MSRREELSANLAGVRDRIRSACEAAGRRQEDVTLVVVTKTFPASDVRLLAELGVTDVGENRHQEAAEKAAECADLDLRWHFVGGLQSNKAAAVASYADVVESLDRVKLIAGLQRGAHERSRPIDCLLQVSLDPPERRDRRSGASPEELDDLAAGVRAAGRLRLRGLMAVAPPDGDPDVAFARLASTAADFRGRHPDAGWLSAGMSADLEAALKHGATHVRIGAAILGPRPASR